MKIKTVYFEITNQCNLNCMTCYNRSGYNTDIKELSKTQLKQSIDILIGLGLNRVLISGGEPSLHSEFDGILELISEYPQLSFGIVTNGTLHSEKLINLFNSADNMTLQISLDGSTEELNSKTRCTGNFDKAINLISRLHNSKVKPLIKMVVSQNNYDDIEAFYRLAVSAGTVPEYAFINKQGNGSAGWEQKYVTGRQKLDALKLIDRLNKELNTEAFLPLCTSKCPYIDDFDNMSVCVKADGTIQPCQLLYDEPFSLGNILNFDLSGFAGRVEYISRLAKKRNEADYGCRKCIINNACEHGCMASAYNLTGDTLGDDGDCEFRKLQFVGYNMDLKSLFNRE